MTTNPEQRAREIWQAETASAPRVDGVWDANASVQRAMLAMWVEALEEAAKVADDWAAAREAELPLVESGSAVHGEIVVRLSILRRLSTAIRALSSSAQGEGA